MTSCKMRGDGEDINLADIIFSWSLEDIENECLYKVEMIPETFHSREHYLGSFRLPLLEDTRAQLLSSSDNIADAPFAEVVSFYRGTRSGKSTFCYDVTVDQWKNTSNSCSREPYITLPGDVLVLSDAKLGTSSDLDRVGRSWTLASVISIQDDKNVDPADSHRSTRFSIKTPKKIDTDDVYQKSRFVTFLMNITTHGRIWKSLNMHRNPDILVSTLQLNTHRNPDILVSTLQLNTHRNPDILVSTLQLNMHRNPDIVKALLDTDSQIWKPCNICPTDSEAFHDKNYTRDLQAKLNESQAEAVLRCLHKVKCNHKSSVDLIWGPPGTGKTKTISVLLLTLLRMKCRTLICAPTNIAVKEVASRVISLVMESADRDSENLASLCSLGDVLLFGNNRRLNVKDSDLEQIELDYRVKRLAECLAPLSGLWSSFASMIKFFEDCSSDYCIFLDNELIEQERRKKENDQKDNGKQKSFLEFARERFSSTFLSLEKCFLTLCTHLPENFILKRNIQNMCSLINLLDSFETFLFHGDVDSQVLKDLFSPTELVGHDSNCSADFLSKLLSMRIDCLSLLYSLKSSLEELNLPSSLHRDLIEELCFQKATLIFCTASSSYKLHKLEEPLELLVVDEAAQLKECETSIPLQLGFINHVILIGDECQLPAIVHSQNSLAAGFGRSLFERLSSLGYPKHLLNIQYRMHPSISCFPNSNFYYNQIIDASIVKNHSHEKRYLRGPMFGPYSFINVSSGREDRADSGPSRRNMVEVGIVMKILQILFKAWDGQNLRVGVISPYAAQVEAIKEKVGKKYEELRSFSVNVKSVDGFQGGEEDIIILTTVRSNNGGAIGFMSDSRRVNVALTRARHCLWILGNERTLVNSESIWEELVRDAKERQCFFNADEDMEFRNTIIEVKKELDQLDDLLDGKSELFKNARWKVLFSEYFRKSFRRLASIGSKASVMNVLLKLSNGWRPKKSNVRVHYGTSQILRQFKVEGLYIICSTDIVRERMYIQVLKVWDVLPLEEIPKLSKRLDGIFEKYTDDFISRCKEICIEGGQEVPKRWPASFEIIRYKSLANNDEGNDSCSKGPDVGCYVENSRVSDSLLLMKFYSLSSRVVNHLLLKGDGGELELPFEVTDEEREVITFPRSTFILGRSGTGKTTVLTTKLFNREQVYSIAADGYADVPRNQCWNFYPRDDDNDENDEISEKCGQGVGKSILRQLFVTVSPKLCYAIKRQVLQLKSFASGGTYSTHNSPTDLEDIDGTAQFKSIPDTFVEIPPKLYPLVISFQHFLMMLDKTCGNSYFERFPDVRFLLHDEKGSPSSVFVQSFIRTREVSYDKFCSAYWPHFNLKLTKSLDSSRVYTEIMSHIKGSLRAGAPSDWKLERKEYVELSEGRTSTLSKENREMIYDIYRDYEKMKMENGDFDLADLVIDLHVRLTIQKYEGDIMDFVYIDEVQDLTMKQIALFKHICKNVDEGFIFAGDTAQTIARGIDFRFEDVRSLFYNEFVLGSNYDAGKGQISKTYQLSQNFRTHAGILHLAQSVIDLLYRFFPSNVDILSHERSLIFGEAPILVESGNDENAILTIFGGGANSQSTFVGFGADQVILVRNEAARSEIKDYVGKQALVLTILECKGLEFQDVLLYNFFGSSPLKNKWRVVYLYMKEQGLLNSSFSSIPCFDLAKHNILCSELKQLYVAITRTRQRLWICENTVDFSEPMFDCWKKRGLVQVRKLDESLAQGMQVASTPEEWKSQGYKLLQEGNYEMATICFERAGDEHGEKLAKAAGLKATADRMHSSNPEKASVARRQAAEIFEEIGKVEYAAGCFYVLKEYERAGRLYLLCGQPAMESAGECFMLAGCFELAADVYFKAMHFSKCLSACTKGRLFDAGLKYVNMRKQLLTTDKNIIDKSCDLDRCEQEFLESTALYFYKLNNKGSFMRYVKAFGSSNSMRKFLRSLGCYDELMLLEEEMGNFVEAASIAKMIGKFLDEADLLRKAGHYRDASMLILRYALSHSLWSAESGGWPLKQFPSKEELLAKAKSYAKNESEVWYEFVCAEAGALTSGHSDLFSLKQQLDASERQKSILGEILLTRKIVDMHFHVSPSKYTWDYNMVNDLEQWSAYKISMNYISCETLIHFFKRWEGKIVNVLQYLGCVDIHHTEENQVIGGFCLSYFGVRKEHQTSNTVYVLINPDADWVRGIESKSFHENGVLKCISLQQFVTAARSYWSAELLAVGMKVLAYAENLHQLSVKNSMPLFDRSRPITYMYEVAESLLHSPFIDRKSRDNKELQKFVEVATANFFGYIYPLDWREGLKMNMISFKRSEVCGKLLSKTVSQYVSSRNELTFGQLGRMAVILLGFGQPNNELRTKIENGLKCSQPWQNFIEHLNRVSGAEWQPTGNNAGVEYEESLIVMYEVLNDTFNADWRKELDYISPGCFLYLVERLLIFSCYSQGYILSTKSSIVEWLMHPDPILRRISDFMGRKPKCAKNVLHFTKDILCQILYNTKDTKEWIMKSPTSNKNSFCLTISRAVMMLCLLYLNFGVGDEVLSNLCSNKNVASMLPAALMDALQRGWNRTFFHLVVDRVAQAFISIGDPLVVVNLDGDSSRLFSPNIMAIDMITNQNLEEVLNVLFPIVNGTPDIGTPQNPACSSTGVALSGSVNQGQGQMSNLQPTNWSLEIERSQHEILTLLSDTMADKECLLVLDKVDLREFFQKFMDAFQSSMQKNLPDHEAKVLCEEASFLIRELQQLLAVLHASDQKDPNNDPNVGTMLGNIRSKIPRIEAVLCWMNSQQDENPDAANTDKQSGVCCAEKEDGNDETDDGSCSAGKQVANASLGAQGNGCPSRENEGKAKAKKQNKNKKGKGGRRRK